VLADAALKANPSTNAANAAIMADMRCTTLYGEGANAERPGEQRQASPYSPISCQSTSLRLGLRAKDQRSRCRRPSGRSVIPDAKLRVDDPQGYGHAIFCAQGFPQVVRTTLVRSVGQDVLEDGLQAIAA